MSTLSIQNRISSRGSIVPQQPYRNHGNTYSAVFFALLVAGSAAAVSFIPFIIGPSIRQAQIREHFIYVADFFQCVYYSILTIICLWFVGKYKYFINVGQVRLPTILPEENPQIPSSNIQTKHSASVQLTLFGVGSISYLICNVVKVASEQDINTVQIVSKAILLLSFMSFNIFLRLYRGAFLQSCRLFQYSIALMLGIDASAWIFITVHPLWGLIIGNEKNQTTNSTDHDDFQMNFETVIEITETCLEPFFVEFLSISVGCLLSILFAMRSDTASGSEHNHYREWNAETHETNIQDYGALLNEINEENLTHERQITEITAHRRHKRIVIAVSAFMAIGYFVSNQFFSAGSLLNILNPYVPLKASPMIFKTIALASHLPSFIMCLVSLKKIQQNEANIPKMAQFTSSDNLLLFTTAVHFSYYCLRLITALGIIFDEPNTSKSTLTYYIMFTISSLLAKWAQNQRIISAHYIHRSGQELPNVVELTLINIFAMNIDFWLGGFNGTTLD